MRRLSFFVCFISFLGISCSSFAVPTPAVVPIDTPTNVPVLTIQPTSTISVSDDTSFEENITILVSTGDFSVEVPFMLLSEVDGDSILVSDEEGTFFIMFSVDPNEDNDTLETLLDLYFAVLEKKGISFLKEPSREIVLNDLTGIRREFSGAVQDVSMEGSSVAILSNENFVFIGFGLAKIQSDPDAWKNNGLPNFDKLINSLTFFDNNAECPVSTDETYGYTAENPIQVGGGDFGGPSRERAYLDHLLDSSGTPITYNRTGSTMVGDVILDVYELSTSDEKAIIYIDEYNYASLQAPIGFICQGSFPLSEP